MSEDGKNEASLPTAGSWRLIRLTFPFVRRALVTHRGKLGILAALSVLLGVVPTLKASLESALVNEAASVLSPRGTQQTPADQRLTLDEIADRRLEIRKE